MTDKYYLRGKIKKLEVEMWNMKVKGTDVGLVRRNLTEDLNLCAQNATITIRDNVLQNATSVTELAIWLVIIEVLQMPTLLTTKGVLGLGHFKRECPKLKNNNRVNQAGNRNAPAKV
nr:hypothetical protein [Tanacetum cinerariifolium]